MLAALKAFILALPALVTLAEKILNGIQEKIEIEKENALKQSEILALQKAEISKDSSGLEQILGPQ